MTSIGIGIASFALNLSFICSLTIAIINIETPATIIVANILVGNVEVSFISSIIRSKPL